MSGRYVYVAAFWIAGIPALGFGIIPCVARMGRDVNSGRILSSAVLPRQPDARGLTPMSSERALTRRDLAYCRFHGQRVKLGRRAADAAAQQTRIDERLEPSSRRQNVLLT